jgi:uncharacterized delta-60 repeat protein
MKTKFLLLISSCFIATLLFAQPGTNDPTFNPGLGTDATINAITLQSDGKILIGGSFNNYNGVSRNGIVRLNEDGSLDVNFNPGSALGQIYGRIFAFAIQPDGKIIIGGDFSTYNGTARNRISRINADGSLDASFDPGSGANGGVYSISIQPDNKIIITGCFNTYNGISRGCVARLNSDGSIDPSFFNIGSGANSCVSTSKLLSNGQIIISGSFDFISGPVTGPGRIARLNADGSVDATFNAGNGLNYGSILTTSFQPDGKIIIGGNFVGFGGTPRTNVARLNANGTLDLTFDSYYGASSIVDATALQADGKVIIVGRFTSYGSGGNSRNYIARLNANGSLDTSFNPGTGASNFLFTTAIQPDGKVLIGGSFTSYNGTARNNIARILGDATWTGNISREWNNAGNWSAGVPAAGADVNISQGLPRYPILEVSPVVGNLTIATGAAITIPANQSLTVSGVLTNNGTITVASGGSLVQEDGSTLAGTGTYVVQRAVAGGQRFIGSPVNNHSISGFGISPSGTNGGQIIPVTNPLYRCNADSIAANSPYGNILELREDAPVIDNCAQSLWHIKSSGNLSNARGYAVNVAATTTLSFSGTINNDDISYGSLSRQAGSLDQWNGNATTTRGWHLVSNPYPSPITFTNGSLGADFDNQVQLFDGNSFVPFILSAGPVTIAVGQGFQIRKTAVGGSSTFSVNNNMRVAGNPTFYRQQSPFNQYINITLSNTQYSDKSTVYFEDDATTAFDSKYDANRLFGAPNIPLLYTKETNGEYLAYNALPLLETGNTQTVPVGVYDGATAGEFTLTFEGISTLNATVMLEDLKLNSMQPVNEGSTYAFNTETGDSRDRFLLHFEANLATGIINMAIQEVRLFPNPTTGETNLILTENHGFSKAVITDVSGRVVQQYELSANKKQQTLNTAPLNNGIYFIQLTGSNSNQTLKLIKQ